MKRILLLSFVLLTACATPQERAQRMVARYAPQCEALGYKTDTDPWRQCILSMRHDDRRAAAALATHRMQTTCTNFGNTTTCN